MDKATIDITVVDVTGARTEDVTVPGNAPVGRILNKLVELMGLPTVGPDGMAQVYKFHHKQSGRVLQDSETPASAGVIDGHVLRLVPDVTAG